jgi:hypothetical protein
LLERGLCVEESDTSALVKILGEKGSYHIEITFSAKQPETNMAYDPAEGFCSEADIIDFLVTVNKGAAYTIVYTCSAVQGLVEVSSVTYTSDLTELEESFSTFDRTVYKGPDYTALDPSL